MPDRYRLLQVPDEYDIEQLQSAVQFERFLLHRGNRTEPSEQESSTYPLDAVSAISPPIQGNAIALIPDRSAHVDLNPERIPELRTSNDGSHVSVSALTMAMLGFQYLATTDQEANRTLGCSRNLCLRSVQAPETVRGNLATIGDSSRYGWMHIPCRDWYAQFSPNSDFVAAVAR